LMLALRDQAQLSEQALKAPLHEILLMVQ